ncbi:MAG: hypothetical protein AB1560_13280 [Pseudomonadota bacterium]
MTSFQRFATASIAALAFISFTPSAWAACDFAKFADGEIVVGQEVATVQQAVDVAKNCEFQISGFSVPPGATVSVTSGSKTITNNQSGTVSWIGGSDSIIAGELIQIGGSGKWYEVASVTNTSLTVTREIEQTSGNYSYAVSIQPIISIIGGVIYEESVNLTGLHYVSIKQHLSGTRPIVHSWDSFSFFNEESIYGHLRFKNLDIFGESSPVMQFTDGDVDLTIDSCDLHSRGYDAFDSASYGNYVFTNSRIESRNDVAFVGSEHWSSHPVRSVIVTRSSFISAGTNPSSPASPDVGFRKLLIIYGARAGGQFLIDKSTFSIATRTPGDNVGVAFSPVAPSDPVTLNISDSSFSCTDCNGTVSTGMMMAAVNAHGSGVTINIDKTKFATRLGGCAVAADQGAKIIVTNSSWPYDSNGNAPVCTATGGQVIY